MLTKTQILSHYSAHKSNVLAALCGRAGHLIKTPFKKKRGNHNHLLRVTQGFLKAHMAICYSMHHCGDSWGSPGGWLAGLEGGTSWLKWSRSSVRAAGWHCPSWHSALGACCGSHTQPTVWGKTMALQLKMSWPPPPNVSDLRCPLYIHATPSSSAHPWYCHAHGIK